MFEISILETVARPLLLDKNYIAEYLLCDKDSVLFVKIRHFIVFFDMKVQNSKLILLLIKCQLIPIIMFITIISQ